MWDPEAPSRSVPLPAWLVQPRAREPVCPGFRLLLARPPLCPAADAVREPWAGSTFPLATENFLAWGLRGSIPPQKAA